MRLQARLSALIFFFLVATNAWSQSTLAGEWEGTLKGSDGNDYSLVLRLTKKPAGGYSADVSVEDMTPKPLPVASIAITGTSVRFSVAALKGTYRGTLEPDSKSMRGQWTDEDGPVPLNLEHLAPHKISFVTVAPNVKLEVLDWGGTGRPLVLLAGLGDTAHAFDKFAPKLTAQYHVYGITRRGFGSSSAPSAANPANYTADRLGDDVLAIFTALHLEKPILAGHSIAGEELSSIGSRHPERVAGLIYLDAAYGQAFYDPALGDYEIDLNDLGKKIDQLLSLGLSTQQELAVLQQIQADLPRLQHEIQTQMEVDKAIPDDPPVTTPPAPSTPLVPATAIEHGEQKYTSFNVPILAIYAFPGKYDDQYPKDPKAAAAAAALDIKYKTPILESFARLFPTAKVVRIPNADHYVFKSNEADVLREINAFAGTLPR